MYWLLHEWHNEPCQTTFTLYRLDYSYVVTLIEPPWPKGTLASAMGEERALSGLRYSPNELCLAYPQFVQTVWVQDQDNRNVIITNIRPTDIHINGGIASKYFLPSEHWNGWLTWNLWQKLQNHSKLSYGMIDICFIKCHFTVTKRALQDSSHKKHIPVWIASIHQCTSSVHP